jgi:hypothetical protein
VTYDQFRTGLTFAEVRRMLWVNSPDPAMWRYKRRNTVLGHWRAIKLAMWREYERREDELTVLREVASCESQLPF